MKCCVLKKVDNNGLNNLKKIFNIVRYSNSYWCHGSEVSAIFFLAGFPAVNVWYEIDSAYA